MPKPFNSNDKVTSLGTVDYIPHSLIRIIKHYPANILVTTYEPDSTGTGPRLFVTKEFSVTANGIHGEFEEQPDEPLNSISFIASL